MRKRTRNIMIVSAAVLAAAIVAFPAAMALVPGSVSRYIDDEHFSGEVVTDTTEGGNHGGHSGWTDLNDTQTNTVDGVAWTTSSDHDTCTISADGKFFLSADLDANIVIATDNVTVDLCLAGHALSAGYASNDISAVLLGKAYDAYWSGTKTAVTLNLYDCGYDSVHYYKNGEAHTLLDGAVMYEGYDFSDATLTAETADGYVRGGLITGGDATKGNGASTTPSSSNNSYGGGVSVGPGCTLNMYGGTIAGNVSRAGGGVMVWGGTFTMYGGTIAGNSAKTTSTGAYDSCGGGVAVLPSPTNGSSSSKQPHSAAFTMYGGRICDNYAEKSGGGVVVIAHPSSSGTYPSDATTFTMNGGVISGNEASSSVGGGVYVAGYSSGSYPVGFTMSGGTIRDNVSGSSGGGVDAANSNVTVTVTDGEITGNRENRDYPASSSVRGGGLCFNSSGTLTIGGSTYIYGNYSGGKICNLGLGSSYNITLNGLTEGARIGVTKAGASNGTKITTNYETGVEARFLSDERTFRITANGSYLQLTSK